MKRNRLFLEYFEVRFKLEGEINRHDPLQKDWQIFVFT